MNKKRILYKGLPFAFDDIPILGSHFVKETKTWNLYFDEYYDIEKDASVEGFCFLSIEKWDIILFKEYDENLNYQVIDEIVIPNLDQIAHLEYNKDKKQLKMVVFTKQSTFYDIIFANALCNLNHYCPRKFVNIFSKLHAFSNLGSV